MSYLNPTNVRPVMGHLARNWIEFNDKTPAVVLNPQAQPLDLMAWVWGELQSVQAAAYALADGRDDIDKGAFNSLIIHRISPLLMVFEAAIDQMALDAKKDDPTPAASPGHQAIDEALRAALFYLHAANIPEALPLATTMAKRAVRLFDKACEKGDA